MHKQFPVIVLSLFFVPQMLFAADAPINRVDGFLQIWEGIKRPAVEAKETPYADVPKGSKGFTEITYAKKRGLLDSTETFGAAHALTLGSAELMLLRTRNVDDINLLTMENLPTYLEKYPMMNVLSDPYNLEREVSATELSKLITSFDDLLKEEVHEVSNYGQKFHGKGTAFGETFDMNAMTAAHRSFPHNTMVKVTNVVNGKSVIVRINDRGPFVEGRDMDMSATSFYMITDRSGVMDARFERLGDASIVVPEALPVSDETVICTQQNSMQQRIGGGLALLPGIPKELALGNELKLTARKAFAVRKVQYPDGTTQAMSDWVNPGEKYTFKPSIAGVYRFSISGSRSRTRVLTMQVKHCQ